MQQGLPDTEQQRGHGGAQLAGSLLQLRQLRITDRHGQARAAACLARQATTRKIRGQGQWLATIAELFDPPLRLSASLVTVQPLLLPGRIVRVLNRCGVSRQRLALMGPLIQFTQLCQQQLHGHAITNDVVLHQQQVITLRRDFQHLHPQQIIHRQIERTR